MCDEIIHAEAKSNDEETKTVLINFNKKYNLQNTKFLNFSWFFINYHCIITAVSITVI